MILAYLLLLLFLATVAAEWVLRRRQARIAPPEVANPAAILTALDYPGRGPVRFHRDRISLLFLGARLALILLLVAGALDDGLTTKSGFVLLSGLAASVIQALMWTRERDDRRIELRFDGVLVPRREESGGHRILPWSRIERVTIRARPGDVPALVLEADGLRVDVDSRSLNQPLPHLATLIEYYRASRTRRKRLSTRGGAAIRERRDPPTGGEPPATRSRRTVTAGPARRTAGSRRAGLAS